MANKSTQSIRLTAAQNRIKELESQLKSTVEAHDAALVALEDARKANRKKRPSSKQRALSPKKNDIVEVIVSDIHGAKQDPKAVAAFMGDLRVIQPDRIVILGDLLDCGGFLSSFQPLYIAETEDSYEDDIAAANHFLDQIDEICPNAEVHYIHGNHEFRVERWCMTQKVRNKKDLNLLMRQLGPDSVLNIEGRGYKSYGYGQVNDNYSVPGWVELDGMHFTHKVSLAKNAADASLGSTAGNIMFGDTHRQDYKPTVLQDGTLRASWNTGCLCKRQPTYANTRPTGWTHGYCVRFIDKKMDTFQVIQILINEGVSLAGHIFSK